MAAPHDNIVVIDYGSRNIKAGYASTFLGESDPRVIIPTAVTRAPAGHRPPYGSAPPSLDTTLPADVSWPVQQGAITDFDQLEALLHHTLYGLLGWVVGDEGSLVIAEPLLASKSDRERLAQLAFEVFNTQGVFFQDQAALSMYAVGKLTGCVVDMGHGKIDVACVQDGATQPAAVRRLAYTGADMSTYLARLLRARGAPVPQTPADLDALKEQCAVLCDSAADYNALTSSSVASMSGNEAAAAAASTAGSAAAEPRTYQLPDGQRVTITQEGADVAESLFRPALLGHDGPNLVDALAEVINGQPESSGRRQLAECLFICGGGSSLPRLQQRVVRELQPQLPAAIVAQHCTVPDYLPSHAAKHAAWIGGAIVGKVVHAQSQFMVKGDYEESGPSAVHYKGC